MKIIGAGYSRTGTRSLQHALEALGFSCIHFDTERLTDVIDSGDEHPDFHRYDDVDAVVDLPAAYFYRELMDAYPDALVILTVRDLDDWWRSVKSHLNFYGVTDEKRIIHRLGERFGIRRLREPRYDSFRRKVRNLAYGSATPHEFQYKKKYQDHNDLVMATVPPERLLVMNISAGDGWDKLCPFVGRPIPNSPFPHDHKSKDELATLNVKKSA